MAEAVVTTPRERGWKRLLLALAAFLLVPLLPVVQSVVPVERATVLLVPALAVCALVGWRRGGRLSTALIWAALTVWIMSVPVGRPSASYVDLVHGWALLAAGTFGLVTLYGTSRSFLPRALSALGLAAGAVLLLIATGMIDPVVARSTLDGELTMRNVEWLRVLRQLVDSGGAGLGPLAERLPSAQDVAQQEEVLPVLSRAALLAFPALLLLETLAALALAWALYHRLARARLGAPLAPLREFRFNDQLVWGLITGVVIVVLPTLAALRGVGVNLLVFFGALYALRGLGVLAWMFADHTAALVVSSTATVVLGLWIPDLLRLAAALAVGVGLGDTWRDWRRQTRPTT